MLLKCAQFLIFSGAVVAITLILAVFYVYQVKTEGVLHLDRIWGEVQITREVETQIPHIKGEDYNSVCYGQGFVHAQTRLW